MWVWVNTYRYIFSGMNIHLPAILGFTRYQGFDPSPCVKEQLLTFSTGGFQDLQRMKHELLMLTPEILIGIQH